MRKRTLIIISLLLVSLVLAGASCEEDERSRRKKDEDEEEEELLEKKLTDAQIEDVLIETTVDLGWGSRTVEYSDVYGFHVKRVIEDDWGENYTRLQIGDISKYSDKDFAMIIEGAAKKTFIKKWCELLISQVEYGVSMESELVKISGFDACYSDTDGFHNVTRAFVGNYEVLVEHWNNSEIGAVLDSRALLKTLIDNLLDALNA